LSNYIDRIVLVVPTRTYYAQVPNCDLRDRAMDTVYDVLYKSSHRRGCTRCNPAAVFSIGRYAYLRATMMRTRHSRAQTSGELYYNNIIVTYTTIILYDGIYNIRCRCTYRYLHTRAHIIVFWLPHELPFTDDTDTFRGRSVHNIAVTHHTRTHAHTHTHARGFCACQLFHILLHYTSYAHAIWFK